MGGREQGGAEQERSRERVKYTEKREERQEYSVKVTVKETEVSTHKFNKFQIIKQNIVVLGFS